MDRFLLYFIIVFIKAVCHAQNPLCPPNIDFENGTTSGWIATGETNFGGFYFSNCCSTVPGTPMITAAGMPNDVFTNIPVTAPNGSGFSVRLGDYQLNSLAADQLKRPISITSNNFLFTYNYAVQVFGCQNFPPSGSAAALIFFLDQHGDTIPCSKQSFNPRLSLTGFTTYTVASTAGIRAVYAVPWQTKTLDLSSYIGQTVTPNFMVRCCNGGVHTAYMYLDVVCNAQPDQTIFCQGESGTICAPMNCPSCTWTSPSGTTSSSQCILPTVGVYTLQVPAEKGCLSNTSVFTYTVGEKPVADFNFHTSCPSLDYVFNDQSIMGTTAPCHNRWKIQNTVFTTPAVNYHFNSPGNYTVSMVASDCSNRCRDSLTKTVTVLPPLKALFTTVQKSCTGDSVLFTNTSVESYPSTYAWDFGTSHSSSEDPEISFSTAGTYPVKLVVKDSTGCKDSIVKSVVVTDYPKILIHAGNMCINRLSDFNADVLNNVAVDQWKWDFQSDGITDASTQHAGTVYHSQGSFSVTLSAASSDGCTTTETSLISVYPVPHASYTLNADASPLISFTNTSITPGNSQLISTTWNFGEGFTENNPAFVLTHAYSQPGAYRPLLAITNSFGCSDTISQPFVVGASYAVYIPNAFTPNGDDLNDLFKIEYFGIAESELSIFDRWGALIYTSKDKDAGWNGAGKGQDYKQDVYVWRLVYKEFSGEEHYKTGSVSLVR